MKIFYVLSGLALLAACRKGGAASPETEALILKAPAAVETTAGTALVSDQSFIDFVAYAADNLGAGIHLRSRLGASAPVFFQQLQSCTGNSSCINAIVADYGVDGALLDEYFFSAMSAALLFQVARPEFEKMTEVQRNALFAQAITEGFQSSDLRWVKIRQNLDRYRPYFQNDLYKADPGWNQIAGCVIKAVGGIFTSVLGLMDIKSYIKSGKIAKAVSTIKDFLKTGLGRTLSWVGLALTAWEIADCIYDLYYPDPGTVWLVRPGLKPVDFRMAV